jgi:hypothetical protein
VLVLGEAVLGIAIDGGVSMVTSSSVDDPSDDGEVHLRLTR